MKVQHKIFYLNQKRNIGTLQNILGSLKACQNQTELILRTGHKIVDAKYYVQQEKLFF